MNLIFYKNSLLGFFLLFSYAVFGQIMIDKEVIEHPTCHDSLDGKIALKIKGGVLPYSFLWSNGVTLDSIEDVKHGVYQVTITDNATPKNKLIKSFTLSNPAPMEFFYHFECSTVFKDKSNHTLWFDSIKNVKLFTIYENTSFVQTPNILTYTWEDMMPPNTGIIVPAYDFGNYYVHIKIVDESKKYSKQGGMYRETCRAKFLITPPKEIKEMISASIDSPDTLFIQKGKTLKETLKSNYFTTTTRKSSLTHEWRRYEGTKIEKYKYKNLDCDFCM
jgi:hypothetical protein